MGRKRRERTKPKEEGEARNGDGGGRRDGGREEGEADLGAEAPPSGLARAATAVFRGKGGEEL